MSYSRRARALMLVASALAAPADGRCKFERNVLERSGFETLAFDRDDLAAARAMGHALGWDQGDHPMDLERDLFANYTLLKRRGR